MVEQLGGAEKKGKGIFVSSDRVTLYNIPLLHLEEARGEAVKMCAGKLGKGFLRSAIIIVIIYAIHYGL